jgi:hypothetical protein
MNYGKFGTISLLGVAVGACLAPAAQATIIYNGAQTYTIQTTVTDNIIVNNGGAVLNVEQGGVVQGVNDPSVLGAVRTQAGTLNVTGNGQIIGAAGQNAISMQGYPAVVRLQDRSTVTGNIVMEYNTPGWRNEATAQTRLYLQGQSVVNGDLLYANFIRIEDDARLNGDLRHAPNGSISLDMRGGEIAGVVDFGTLNDYEFNMSGGSILSGFRGDFGFVNFNMSGGYIGGGISTGNFVSGTISGGQIEGGISTWHGWGNGGSDLTVTGGQFDATTGDYLVSMTGYRFPNTTSYSSLDILGGEWGYNEAGLGFFFDEFVNFSITGWDLTFIDGLLSGYLSDGNWFSNSFGFGASWQGTFTINNMAAHSALAPSVPEPGTLGIFLAGLAGAMVARRRRAQSVGTR